VFMLTGPGEGVADVDGTGDTPHRHARDAPLHPASSPQLPQSFLPGL